MKNAKVDLHQVLNVFQKITEYGTTVGDEKFLDGIFATAGFDGYSVTLRDDKCQLTIGFHNTLHLNAKNTEAEETFLKRITTIDSREYSPS